MTRYLVAMNLSILTPKYGLIVIGFRKGHSKMERAFDAPHELREALDMIQIGSNKSLLFGTKKFRTRSQIASIDRFRNHKYYVCVEV